MSTGSCVESILKNFTDFIGKPEDFLVVQTRLAEKLQASTKDLYDLVKVTESEPAGDALPELIITGFDDEQVWQEIELQNDPLVSSLLTNVSHVVASKELEFFSLYNDEPPPLSYSNSEDDMEYENNDVDSEDEKEEEDEDNLEEVLKDVNFAESDANDESEEERELKELLNKVKKLQGSDDESMDESSENESDLESSLAQKGSKKDLPVESSKQLKSNLKKRKTVVDDTFFKLADLESFLEKEDAREERKIRMEKKEVNEEEESSEEEEEIDFFADLPSSDEEGKGGRNLTYADFFDPPDEETPKHGKPGVKFQDRDESKDFKNDEDGGNSRQEDSDESEEEEDEADEESEGEDVSDILGGQKRQPKSSFEERQERLQRKISELEDMSLAEKPWQLLGEVSAESRPENSLLQEDLDYDHATRQAPVVTEETTKKLEDIIIQRIKDKAWDDVERKEKPKEEVKEYKKRLVLDQEKSKLSLGEVYEQEYLKQQQKDEEETADPQHEEISKMMTSLFVKLDALSNFHYTPKQSVPDVKIVSNLPSISMEEVAPVSASSQTLLAPEEIKEKTKQDLKGETEKTKTDKKRARREKKARQHEKRLHREEKEKLNSKLKPGLGSKFAQENAMKELKKRSKSIKGGVTIIEDEKKKSKSGLTSSSQFFSQLQDEVTAHVHSKKLEAKKKKKAQEKSSKKLKL